MDIPKVPDFPVQPVVEKIRAIEKQGPEHWILVSKQLVAAAVMLGILNVGDANDLSTALGKIIGAVFVFAINAGVIVHFIQKTFAHKSASLVIALGLWLVGSSLQAAPPILPWRASIDKRLKVLEAGSGGNNQQLPPPPLQLFPQAGPNLQPLPLAGPDRQPLPIAGPDKQLMPIPGPPKQDLPQGGPNKQPLPINGPASPIGAPLPVAPPPANPQPPIGGGPQRMTRFVYALSAPCCDCPDGCDCGPGCDCKNCKGAKK
ncbi:MAG: hypothetical protein KGJ13_06930 [Patescibacteria group bacterium]|nr:hypothetical protein [Patescibacteria group bacterium]